MLEALVDGEKGVEPALDLPDENVVRLPCPSQIRDRVDHIIGSKLAKTKCNPGVNTFVDQDPAHSATKSCTSSR